MCYAPAGLQGAPQEHRAQGHALLQVNTGISARPYQGAISAPPVADAPDHDASCTFAGLQGGSTGTQVACAVVAAG